MPRRDELNVLVLSDGRPGHYNQAKGAVRALEFHRSVKVTWVELRLRSGLFRPFLKKRLTLRRWPLRTSALRRYYRWDPALPPSADLIVSAGGNTLYANAWLSRSLSARNLFIGKIRGLPLGLFWRILSVIPFQPSPPYLHWPLVPVPVVPEELQQRAQRWRATHSDPRERLWTMLVGGNGGGYRYEQADWADLVHGLREQARAQGVRWLVITSRRTGLAAEKYLEASLDDSFVAALSLYSKDKGERYLDFLGVGECIWTTEDSGTMLTEAVYSAKPVVAVRPRDYERPPAHERFLAQISGARYIEQLTLAQMAGQDLSVFLARSTPPAPRLWDLGQRLISELERANHVL